MTVPPPGQSISTHSVSASILLKIKSGGLLSPFSEIWLIVALRQDIFVANMTQRPIESVESYCNTDQSVHQASDVIWCHRIIAHAARVTNFVYQGTPKDVVLWDSLWQYFIDWDLHKPNSFQPICCSSSPSTSADPDEAYVLPRIYCSSDCSAAALQHWQLCRLLLLAYDPRSPVLGLGCADFQRKRDNEIRDAVRIICGVSESNPEYWPALTTAGLAIALSGELFSDPRETRRLYNISSGAEQHFGWPCFKVSRRLS